jgi:hypothetical protein
MVHKNLLDVAVQATIVALLIGIANWLYRLIVKRKSEYGSDREFRRMSKDEMMEGLQRILGDPTTSPEVREKAAQQLKKLQERVSD